LPAHPPGSAVPSASVASVGEGGAADVGGGGTVEGVAVWGSAELIA